MPSCLRPIAADLKARLDRSLAQLMQDGAVAKLRARFGVERDAGWPVA